MKKKFIKVLLFAVLTIYGSVSCTDYLSVLPKGVKTPVTFEDYEALLRYEYFSMTTNTIYADMLLNDQYVSSSYFTWYPIYKVNWYWDEETDRRPLTTSENLFTYMYQTISNCNLILENIDKATNCTQDDITKLKASVIVIRSHCYFVLTNYYAEQYSEANKNKLAVPLILSANLGAEYNQPTLGEMYDFMIGSVEDVLKDVPDKGLTILHPGKGAAYAFLARAYMQKMDYAKALEYSEKALEVNDKLYDWDAFYQKYKAHIEQPDVYTSQTSPLGHDCVENYYFRHGQLYYSTGDSGIPKWRGDQFEEGDAQFLSRWKIYTYGTDQYYRAITTGFYNYGGLSTPEQYLIKAECQVRAGKVNEGMATLNTLRKSRMLKDKYTDMTATDAADAIDKILRAKHNEMRLTIIAVADYKRINAEKTYAKPLTKVEGGKTYTLSPDSHLWVQPFPVNALSSLGNGSFIQNTPK